MPVYTYTAYGATGRKVSGVLEAENEKFAERRLREIGYWVESLSLRSRVGRSTGSLRAIFKLQFIRTGDVVLFARQLATMISAGVPIIRALRRLEEQASNASLANVIANVRRFIEKGSTLADAFARYPRVFPPIFVDIIKAGETGGTLDEMLDRLAGYLEQEDDLRRRIKAALAYPAVVLVFAAGLVVFLVTFLVPRFAEFFKTFKAQLPLPTAIVIGISNFFCGYWWIILAAICLLFFGYHYLSLNKSTKPAMDRFKAGIPILGRLAIKVSISRFMRAFSALLNSGVAIGRSLEVAGRIPGGLVSREMPEVVKSINKGNGITNSLYMVKLFPPAVMEMVAVGEETGNLPQLLDKVAEFYDLEIDLLIKKLIAAIEPALVVCLGMIVGFIVISVYLPIFTLISSIK